MRGDNEAFVRTMHRHMTRGTPTDVLIAGAMRQRIEVQRLAARLEGRLYTYDAPTMDALLDEFDATYPEWTEQVHEALKQVAREQRVPPRGAWVLMAVVSCACTTIGWNLVGWIVDPPLLPVDQHTMQAVGLILSVGLLIVGTAAFRALYMRSL